MRQANRSLIDILACPVCGSVIVPRRNVIHCLGCPMSFPIVNGVPVMLPDCSNPAVKEQESLQRRETYDPWIHRIILQSLLDDHVAVDIGAGNMALDDPCIIRVDVALTPFVDLVADVHALPFRRGSIDFFFSLAVVEHLANPFEAAASMFDALKDGGLVYHECNFVFPYHGYPSHFFNASLSGLERVFHRFRILRRGVAPYQMPSFALDAVLSTYLRGLNRAKPGRVDVATLIQGVLESDLRGFDNDFGEQEALALAAGTFLAGVKETSSTSTIVPDPIVSVWNDAQDVRDRISDLNDLTQVTNVLTWAREDGRQRYVPIDMCLMGVVPFNKRGPLRPFDRSAIRQLPLADPIGGRQI